MFLQSVIKGQNVSDCKYIMAYEKKKKKSCLDYLIKFGSNKTVRPSQQRFPYASYYQLLDQKNASDRLHKLIS